MIVNYLRHYQMMSSSQCTFIYANVHEKERANAIENKRKNGHQYENKRSLRRERKKAGGMSLAQIVPAL